MDNTGSVERDWTKQYRLAAGVYAMRGGQILMLERARGMMTGFWSVRGGNRRSWRNPTGGSRPRAVRGSRHHAHRTFVAHHCGAAEGIRDGPAQPPICLPMRRWRGAAQSRAIRLELGRSSGISRHARERHGGGTLAAVES